MTNYQVRRDVRDSVIRAAQEATNTQDTRIQQKIMAANREGFVQRFPGQLQHAMRLVHERLINCLNKPEGCDLSRPDTWPASPEHIVQLSQALRDLDTVRQNWPDPSVT
jgi:hypothetical protein